MKLMMVICAPHHLLDSHRADALLEHLPINRVPVTEPVAWRLVKGESLHDLMGRPLGARMSRNVEVDDLPPLEPKHDETVRTRKLTVGTVKKSVVARSGTWLARKVRQL